MTKRRGNLDSPAFSCIRRGICSILKKIYPDRNGGKQMEQLETPRLILRGFVMEDLDDFYSYCSDPDVGIHGGREAHQDREQSAEELRKRISEDKTWAICKKESGKNIGMVWLEPDFRRKRSFDRCRVLGYLLAKPEWGQGLMTEAE